MNKNISNFLSNLSSTLMANIVTFLVSVFILLVIPKVLGVEEYGYFQLYLLYSSYVIFFHLGLPNGIYLRYGGKEYKDLDKKMLSKQFWLIALYTLLFAAIGSICALLFIGSEKKELVLLMTCLCGVIIIPRDFIIFLLMATNRIKEYVKATIIDRIIYIATIFFFLTFSTLDFTMLIIADLVGKLVALTWLVYQCKDMIFQRIGQLRTGFYEAYLNIVVGSKILLSNIASMLMIGIMRMGIEDHWDIATFGKISLTLSISNLMMVVINAVSIVIYPILRRADNDDLPKFYSILCNLFMVPLLGIMIFYYPMKELLALWLPSYAESLSYIALLFSICIYESKMSMLVSTYLKILRKEKWILIVNLVSVLVSFLFTIISIYVLSNLFLSIVSIVLVIAFRCIFAEMILSKYIKVDVKKDIYLESLMCVIFMISGWIFKNYLSTLLYAGCYIMYFMIKRMDVRESIREIKAFVKK